MKIKQAFVKKLNEWDDDDDLSPAERALIAKAEKDLAKKGIKVKQFDPDKIVGKDLNVKQDDDDEEKVQQVAKKQTTPAVQTKQEQPTSPEEKKQMMAKGDKVAQARKFLQDNPNATRKQFAEFVAKFGVSPAYANTMFYALKKKLNEVFYIVNQDGKVLAENDTWTNFDNYSTRLLVFKNEWKARKKALQVEGKVETTIV